MMFLGTYTNPVWLQEVCRTFYKHCPGNLPGMECRAEKNHEQDAVSVLFRVHVMHRKGDTFRQGKKIVVGMSVPSFHDAKEFSEFLDKNIKAAAQAFLDYPVSRNRKVWYKTATSIVEVTKDGQIGKVIGLKKSEDTSKAVTK